MDIYIEIRRMLFKRVKKEGSLTGKGNEIDHCDCFNNNKKNKK